MITQRKTSNPYNNGRGRDHSSWWLKACCLDASWDSLARVSASTLTPFAMSSIEAYSSGLWLYPAHSGWAFDEMKHEQISVLVFKYFSPLFCFCISCLSYFFWSLIRWNMNTYLFLVSKYLFFSLLLLHFMSVDCHTFSELSFQIKSISTHLLFRSFFSRQVRFNSLDYLLYSSCSNVRHVIRRSHVEGTMR